MRQKNDDFRVTMSNVLDEHFPKAKSKERSSALMMYAKCLLEYDKVVEQVKSHMNYLLAVPSETERTSNEYKEAKDFYLKLD